MKYLVLLLLCCNLNAANIVINDQDYGQHSFTGDYVTVLGETESQFDLYQSSIVLNGGYVKGSVTTHDNSWITMNSGKIDTVTLGDNGTGLISTGYVDTLFMQGTSDLYIQGGQIREIKGVSYNPQFTLTFLCNTDTVRYSGDYVSGLWLDNSPFHIKLTDYFSQNELYNEITFTDTLSAPVPEPLTLMIMSSGTLYLLRKRRKNT